MKNIWGIVNAEHLSEFYKIETLHSSIAMILFNEGIGLKDIISEGFGIVFVQSDQSISLQNVTVCTLLTLLHVSETKKKGINGNS